MALDIDKIVQQVLARLKQAAVSEVAPHKAAELTLDAKVVTVEQVQKKLSGIRVLSVPKGAIVTPAVRDLLKEKNVQLAWRIAGSTSEKRPAAAICLGVAETNYEPVRLLQGLRQQGQAVQVLARTGLKTVLAEMTDAVARDGQRGLLLTGQPVAAVCLANRSRSIRAVTGESSTAIGQAIQAVGANLLVLDPSRKSEWELKQIIGQFVRNANSPVPNILIEN